MALTDIEIAQQAEVWPISKVAELLTPFFADKK